MTHVFLDTSALIKLYLPEVGSVWLQNYLADKWVQHNQFALCLFLRHQFRPSAFQGSSVAA